MPGKQEVKFVTSLCLGPRLGFEKVPYQVWLFCSPLRFPSIDIGFTMDTAFECERFLQADGHWRRF